MEQAASDTPGQPVNDKGQQKDSPNKDNFKGQGEEKREEIGGRPQKVINRTHEGENKNSSDDGDDDSAYHSSPPKN